MCCSIGVATSVVSALLVATWQSSPTYYQVNEIDEPPLNVQLTIDGKGIPGQIGRPEHVQLEGRTVRVVVTEVGERELRLKHLRFRYPSYFRYEVHYNSGTKVPVRWDLKGHDVDVTVFRAASRLLHDNDNDPPLGSWTAQAFGDNLVTEDAPVLELPQMKLGGSRYTTPLKAGTVSLELSFDAYEVPGDFGDVRYFLLLSDVNGENQVEESLVRKLLRETFEVTERSIFTEQAHETLTQGN